MGAAVRRGVLWRGNLCLIVGDAQQIEATTRRVVQDHYLVPRDVAVRRPSDDLRNVSRDRLGGIKSAERKEGWRSETSSRGGELLAMMALPWLT